ncbi:FGGY family carbohydrate kinase, partial [Klebsiella pneumoniae]
ADRNRSHWSTSKTPSYTKSVSWHHYQLTDISGTNLINVRDCKYDDELLAWWGLDELRDKLPPIKRSTECCGKITDDVARLTGL